jgi:hypothetical protein
LTVATTTAAAVWGLATTSHSRRALADLDIVSLLLLNVKRTFKVRVAVCSCMHACMHADEMSQAFHAKVLSVGASVSQC